MNSSKNNLNGSLKLSDSNVSDLTTVLQSPLISNSPLELPSMKGSSIAFVDSSVENYQQLVAGMAPGIEVHVLQSGSDAISQITQTLLQRHGIESLHIISHGQAGSLDFGSGSLNSYNMGDYAQQFQLWGNALTENADILLYGCNVAEDALGKAFVDLIGQVTGADITASNDLTGNTALGGDWELEYKTGNIESKSAFNSDTEQSYNNTLATIVVNTTADTVASDSSVSLREAIQSINQGFALSGVSHIGNFGTNDTILFSLGSGNQTIFLNSQLSINRAMSIQGSTQSNIIINGDANGNGVNDSGNVRIFFIDQAASVSISNLTLSGGRGQGGNGGSGGGGFGGGGGLGAGGAMFINNGNVTINNVTFSGNSVAGGNGGATGGTGGFGGGGGGGFNGQTGGTGLSAGTGGNGGGISGGTGAVNSSSTGANGGSFGGGGGGFGGSAGTAGGAGGFGGGGGGSGRQGSGNGASGGIGGFGGGGGAGGSTGGASGGSFGGAAGNFDIGGGGAGLGGAVFIRTGSLAISNSTFSNNTSTLR